jgi:hypothetical protein
LKPKDFPRPNQALYYGSAKKPLALAVPDATHLDMWRLTLPDGRTSGLANLTRIKDAGFAIAERGPPHRDFRLLHWRYDHLETPTAHRGCAQRPQPTPTASPPNSAATTVMHICVQP